ncbi:hypothetical protein HK097_007286 [Rhizophlyctis rosea]|uniref:BTB domain-containing protein n=1 Tax=Rhizophlyctis rosea TaxID=64517 RepID=A0AAD5SES4_9FUNG|nr:hypothetical protein HK097_007286 [Rhizophlyctis rosea]
MTISHQKVSDKKELEGRLPPVGDALAAWNGAKENRQKFYIESDTFGPSGCSWKVILTADFSQSEDPKHVKFYHSPASETENVDNAERVYRAQRIILRHIGTTLRTFNGQVWSIPFGGTVGWMEAIEVTAFETALAAEPYFTFSATFGIDATPLDQRPVNPLRHIESYLFSPKMSDVIINIKSTKQTPPTQRCHLSESAEQARSTERSHSSERKPSTEQNPLTEQAQSTEQNQPTERTVSIPAHRLVLAASSDFFRSKFDFEENAGTSGPFECNIEGFNESCIRAMLEFMYAHNIRNMPQKLDDRLQLIQIADFYQIPGLHELVARHILPRMTAGTAMKVMATGYRCRVMSHALAEGAGRYLKANWADLMSKETFRNSLLMDDGLGEMIKFAFERE